MSQMTIGDCRVLANKVAQRLLAEHLVRPDNAADELNQTTLDEHAVTGLIAEAVNEYFGVRR